MEPTNGEPLNTLRVPTMNEVMDSIELFCAPIFISPKRDTPPSEIDDNGTCGFIITDTHWLLITAQHVIQKFRDVQKDKGSAYLSITVGPGNTIALPVIQVIDEEAKYLDLAILNFPNLMTTKGPCDKMYFPYRTAPPPVAGQPISIVGFPNILTQAHEGYGTFEPSSIGYTATSVSERQIVLADEKGDRRIISRDFKKPSDLPLGGFSGSPGYVVRERQLELVGILRAGSKDTANQKSLLPGVIFLTPLTYLKNDGTLDRSQMPWLHS
jgi:hypothetical protein